MFKFWQLGVAFAVLWAVVASGAAAQQRVLVERFSGPQGAGLQRAFVQNLTSNGVTVVSDAEVSEAAQTAGVDGRRFRDQDCVALAQALSASACISGRVSRARRRWGLAIRVTNGADGSSLGARSWGGRTAGALRSVGRSGFTRLQGVLAQAAAPTPPEPEGDPAWYDPNATMEDPLDALLAEDIEPEEREMGERARHEALSVAVGVGTLHRSMATTVGVSCEVRGASAPPGCSPGVVAAPEERSYYSGGLGGGEVGFQVDMYPGAFSEDQDLPQLGLRLNYYHSLFLATNSLDSVGQPISVDTSQSELYVGARARIRLGESRDEGHVFFDLGYGQTNFTFDIDDLASLNRSFILPPMEYGYINLGVAADYSVVPVYVNLAGHLAYRIGLGVGDDARAIWGVDSGLGSSFNFGVSMTSEAPYVAEGAFLRLGLEYSLFRSSWGGNTRCRELPPSGGCEPGALWEPWPYDGEVNNIVPGGGIEDTVNDGYFRLHLAFGYSLR